MVLRCGGSCVVFVMGDKMRSYGVIKEVLDVYFIR